MFSSATTLLDQFVNLYAPKPLSCDIPRSPTRNNDITNLKFPDAGGAKFKYPKRLSETKLLRRHLEISNLVKSPFWAGLPVTSQDGDLGT